MIPELLSKFNSKQHSSITEKEQIVCRLLRKHQISTEEGLVLLRTVNIEIKADKLEMSSGAKIVGGSDFEEKNYG